MMTVSQCSERIRDSQNSQFCLIILSWMYTSLYYTWLVYSMPRSIKKMTFEENNAFSLTSDMATP